MSSGLVEPGSSPSHIGTPMSTVAPTLTALVSTNISTERLAIRSTDTPLLRNTHAPSAMPARPLTDTTELTASSDSDRRETKRRPSMPNTSPNKTTYPAQDNSSSPIPAATQPRRASPMR